MNIHLIINAKAAAFTRAIGQYRPGCYKWHTKTHTKVPYTVNGMVWYRNDFKCILNPKLVKAIHKQHDQKPTLFSDN